MRDVVTVSPDLMRLLGIGWGIDWGGQAAGETNANLSVTVNNAFPHWVGTVPLRLRRQEVLQWRAITDAAQGRKCLYLLPMVDPIAFDRPQAGILFSGGQGFAAGVPWRNSPFVLLAQDVAKGAVSVRVDTSTGAGVPVVGQIMSISDWPFRVTSARQVGAGLYDLGVAMPLRAAATAGDLVMMQGRGFFEMIEDQPEALTYGQNHIARPTFGFREVLKR